MMERIDGIATGCGVYDQISFVDKFHILLGSMIPGLNINQMVEIWFTSAYFISNMYKQRVKTRKGVGYRTMILKKSAPEYDLRPPYRIIHFSF